MIGYGSLHSRMPYGINDKWAKWSEHSLSNATPFCVSIWRIARCTFKFSKSITQKILYLRRRKQLVACEIKAMGKKSLLLQRQTLAMSFHDTVYTHLYNTYNPMLIFRVCLYASSGIHHTMWSSVLCFFSTHANGIEIKYQASCTAYK